MAEIPAILQGLATSNHEAMNAADQLIQQELAQDYGNTLGFLVQAFANESFPEGLRYQLGLYIKNIMHAADPAIKREKRERWQAASPEHRDAIKKIFMQVLLSPSANVSKAAAQIIGAFAGVEIGVGGGSEAWPELIPTLLANTTSAHSTVHVVANSLQAIGWTCECPEIEQSAEACFSAEDVNNVLTMVVNSLAVDRPDEIQCAALDALINSIVFAEDNFNRQEERDQIVNAVIAMLGSPISKVKSKAYECLTRIVECFYDHINSYIATIYQAAGTTITTDPDEDCVKFALQLWIQIGQTEAEIVDDLSDFQIEPKSYQTGSVPDMDLTYHHLIEGSAEIFIPMLLTQLCRIDPNCDIDDLEDSVSYRVLDLLTYYQSITYDIYSKYAQQYIQASLASDDVSVVFGYITALGLLSNPLETEKSYNLVSSAYELLLGGLQSTHAIIRSQSAWSIAQVFRLYSPAFFDSELLKAFIGGLVPLLESDSQEPGVVRTVCLALHELFLNPVFVIDKDESLSIYTTPLMSAFYNASRTYAGEPEVQESIFEAIADLIGATPYSQTELIVQTLNMAISSLQESLAVAHDEKGGNYRSSLLGTMSACCKEIMRSDDLSNRDLFLTDTGSGMAGDNAMTILMTVMGSSALTTIHEESLLAVGYIAQSLKAQFSRYCVGTQLFPMIHTSLTKFEDDHMLAIVAMGTTGDIFKAVASDLTHEICDPFMEVVSRILMSNTVMRDVKTHALQFCGDVCLSCPSIFLTRYAPLVLDIIEKASTSAVISEHSDEDFVEYITDLRESMMYVYACIVDCLGTMNQLDMIESQCNLIFTIICQISDDAVNYGQKFGSEIFEEELMGACGVIGDVAKYLKQRSINYVFHPKVTALVQKCLTDESFQDADNNVRKTAEYAMGLVNACRQ